MSHRDYNKCPKSIVNGVPSGQFSIEFSYATAVEISDVIVFSYDSNSNSKLLNYSVETKDGSSPPVATAESSSTMIDSNELMHTMTLSPTKSSVRQIKLTFNLQAAMTSF